MSWRVEILAALRTRLATVSGIGSWPTVYANRENDSKPGADESFIEERPFSSSSDDTAIGQAVRWREIVGTWQLMLCVPVDSDVMPALTFADLLETTFLATPSLFMADGVTPIRLSNVLVGEPRAARADDPWVRIPVVFKYTVNTHT